MLKILTFLILSVTVLLAGNTDSTQTKIIEKNNALIFQIDQLSLKSFGGGIGYKHWSNNNLVYLGVIKFALNNYDKEETGNLLGEENKSLKVGIELSFEKHFDFYDKLSPFIGFTVGTEFERTENKTLTEEDYFFFMDSPEKGITNDALFIILRANIGFEYFLDQHLSLTGQYSLGGFYKQGKEKIESFTANSSRSIKEFNIGISAASLMLSIYF